MFSGEIQQRISLMRSDLVQISGNYFELEEKSEEGSAHLTVHVKNPSILFCDLENKKLGYFLNQKCADYVIFEKRENGWFIHIIELKRTIKKKTWESIKEQFAGAIQNVFALAGVLGIEIDMSHIRLYSAYRNDKINDYSNPVRLRMGMQAHKNRVAVDDNDWKADKITVDFLGRNLYVHSKIRLNIETGVGNSGLKD